MGGRVSERVFAQALSTVSTKSCEVTLLLERYWLTAGLLNATAKMACEQCLKRKRHHNCSQAILQWQSAFQQ